MSFVKSCLYYTTVLTALAVAVPSAVYAGSGTITYNAEYVSQFGNGQVTGPGKIALGPDNLLYVTDRYNGEVKIYRQDGTYEGNFSAGFRPSGIAFTNNEILVAVHGENKINSYSLSYNLNGVFANGCSGCGGTALDEPERITVAPDGRIFVTQSTNQIHVYNPDGTYLTHFGSYGTGDTQFTGPVDVAIAGNGNIYITDSYNKRIAVYDSSYQFLEFLAVGGSNPEDLHNPLGIDFDSMGNIYVTDGVINNIKVYAADGTFLYWYGTTGTGNGQFVSPASVLVMDDGRLYVTEFDNHRIQLLTLTSTETFSAAPTGGNESATTPLANLVLNGTGGAYASNFIGYNKLLIDGGDWTLSGTHDFNSDVTINSGTLTNNGTIQATSLALQNGATLAGSGVFDTGLLVLGTVSPGTNGGSDIGTMYVNSYIDNTNATYQVSVNAAGQSDKIVSSDYILLYGATLDVQAASGTYAYNTDYTIMTATNGIVGTFGTITSNLAFLDPVLDYSNPNELILSLTRNDMAPPSGGLDFQPFAQTGNQQATAAALTEYSADEFGGNSAVFNQVLGFSQSEANELLMQIAPDEVAAMPLVQRSLVQNMQAPLFNRLSNVAAASDQPGFALFSPVSSSALKPDQVWIETLGGVVSQDGNINTAGYRLGITGMRGGVDKRVSAKTIIGISAAYTRGNVDFKNSNDKTGTQYGHADLYARHALENMPVIVEGVFGAGGGRIDTSRMITAGGLGLSAKGDTNSYDVTGIVKVSAPIALTQTSRLIPSVGTTISWQRQNSMTETGASPFNLHMNRMTSMPVTITPMLNWQKTIDTNHYKLTPDLGAGANWQLNELDNTVNAAFANSTGLPGFAVKGVRQQPLSLNLTAAVTMTPYTENRFVPNMVAQATAQLNSTQAAGTASLTLKWDW